MSRRNLILTLFTIAFLLVSALLARVLSVDGAERAAITTLVQDEARGDVPRVLVRLSDCPTTSACAERVRAAVAPVADPGGGAVTVLQLLPSAGFTPAGSTGVARVAWRAGSHLPVIQCVRVRRAGDALSGLRIELLAVSPRIRGDAECPQRF